MSKILILGAGASYGHGLTGKPAPPLLMNFFHEKTISKFPSEYRPLFDYINNLNQNDDLEQIFSILDSYSSLAPQRNRRTNINNFGPEFEYCIPIDFLRAYLIDVIVLNTLWLNKGETCPFHNHLANNWLKKDDIAISFNYDLIFDSSLKKTGLWHESTGYGMPIRLSDTDEYEVSQLTLLKPHGSLNWEKSKNILISTNDNNPFIEKEQYIIEILSLNKTFEKYMKIPEFVTSWLKVVHDSGLPQDEFRREQFCFKEDSMDLVPSPFIIMPTPLKPLSNFRHGIMKYIWKEIEKKLSDSSEILSIGFSWRDTHFNSFILSIINRRKLPIRISIVGNDKTFADVNSIFKSLSPAKVTLMHVGNTFEGIINHRIV